ncbi:MAG: hypothetical protein ACR2KJ_11405 [Jatrophihabitans sp.]
MNLVRSEFRKLFSTQVWFWLLLTCVTLTALGVWGTIGGNDDAELTQNVRNVFVSAQAAFTYVPLFVLGVLAVTTEFRYQTITPTVLATPSRWSVVGAKIITYVGVGILYALVCLVVELAMALPWLSARNIDYSLGDQSGAIFSTFLVLVLFTLFGIGAGALLRNQIVAVTLGIIFIIVLGNIVLIIPGVKYIYPYLPTGLVNAIATQASDSRTINDVTLLSAGAAVGILVIWGLGMSLLGAGLSMNRDIT